MCKIHHDKCMNERTIKTMNTKRKNKNRDGGDLTMGQLIMLVLVKKNIMTNA